MPTVFGPSCGPRQGEHGETYDYSAARKTTAGFSFLTERSLLERILPARCELQQPIVTIEHSQLHEVAWLAGRGYNILGVKVPVLYRGPSRTVRGPFLAVLWENMAEPILTGREELGYAKLFCDLPPPRIQGDKMEFAASWQGHAFATLQLSSLTEAAPPPPAPGIDGVLHHRYFPSVAAAGAADVDQMVMTPAGGFSLEYDNFRRGEGDIDFVRSTWEQIPTMHHIVNFLADLPVLERQAGWIAETKGAKDLSDQMVVA